MEDGSTEHQDALENGEADPAVATECDKMNGDVASVVSPPSSEASSKAARQRKQVLTHTEEEKLPVTKVTSKKSKKTKLRRILPAAAPEDVTDDLMGGSTSPPLSCTEYAQYLGLQPTVKFKCFKCSEAGFSSINKLKEHQNVCLKSSRSNTPDSSTGTHSNNPAQNLRITRKVYMCSSCGTYFENWNLYIHMREVHRRHVCLVCLGMFMHAEKLALHLSSKHNTTLEAFATTDDFLSAFPSSTYLTCCTCERIFSEQDNFFEHDCGEKKGGENKGCAMCGVNFAHTQSCPHAEASDKTPPSPEKSAPVTSQPSTSEQQEVEEEEQVTPLDTPPVKPPVKKRVRKRKDAKLKKASEEDVTSNNVPPSKLKPTCLRIKLAPVSRQKNKKLTQNCTNLDESSDIEDLLSPDLDLNEELEMLADDTSNPPILQNGERSPSVSPQFDLHLDSNKSNEALDTGQSAEVTEEREPPSGDQEIKETESVNQEDEAMKDSQQNQKVNESQEDQVMDDIDEEQARREDQGKLSEEEDMEVEEPMEQAESSLSDPANDTKESFSDNNDKSLTHSDSMEQSNENLAHSANENSLDQHSDHSLDHNVDSPDNDEDSLEQIDSFDHHADSSDHNADSLDHNADSLDHNADSVDHNDDSLDHNDDSLDHNADSLDQLDNEDSNSRNPELSESTEKVEKTEERVDTELDGDSLDQEEEDDEWHIDEQREEDEPAPVCTGEEEEELQLAGEDSPLMDLVLEAPPDQLPVQTILKLAIQEACDYTYCVYCTHARRIAVNGKQLAIHLLSEHRYQLVVNSERLACEKFIDMVKEHMKKLETLYFNCDTYDSSNKENVSVFVKSYECFQCRYVTKVHKDLYLHNRKMHQKNGLVCIMCKSNFYSYSELLCHLCPGIYNVTNQPLFRCCFCSVDDLPSAFRFMVHVRKRHQACDVCLEFTNDQQKLSNHVWKHKLHHYCYRCGIAYRNKPDITKHLFWKHGTESVLCKRCLQKKWPYVYHFCIPPSSFTCEECNATFSKAVALKVHKRLHTNELLYPCELCNDSFISRKLLARHDRTIHNPPPPEENPEPVDVEKIGPPEKEEQQECEPPPAAQEEVKEQDKTTAEPAASERELQAEKKPTKVVDVYDLPPLNLSSESESESDTEEAKSKQKQTSEVPQVEEEKTGTDTESVPQATDSVWENFKDYKSSKEVSTPSTSTSEPTHPQPTATEMLECVMFDHDYFGLSTAASSDAPVDVEQLDISGEANTSLEHNYCNNTEEENNKTIAEETNTTPKKKQKSAKKKHKSGKSSSSSSDSDSSSSDSSSSSCSCGTNCSCSSSSSSSSGSSSSDSSDSDTSGSEKREKRKAKKKERAKSRKDKAEAKSQAVTVNGHAEAMSGEEPNVEDLGPPVLFFHESDLDTNESETDEDFYDEQPRLLMPNRNLLLLSSAIDSLVSPQPTPAPTPPPSEVSDTFPVNNALLAQLAQEESVSENLTVKLSKSKKRKRSVSTPRRENKLKITLPNILHNQLNAIPRVSVQKKSKSVAATPQLPPALPSPVTPQYCDMVYSPAGSSDIRGSGSETDSNLRLSKRRRVPKKFYGDSSDEEGQTPHTPQMMVFPAPLPPPPPPPPLPPPPPIVIKPPKKKSKPQPEVETTTIHRTPTEADLKLQAILDFVAAGYDGRTADDEDIYKRLSEREALKQPKLIITLDNHRKAPPVVAEEPASSSSEESEESEEEVVQTPVPFLQRPIISNRHDSVKLYCYCQCPYDEVSEMIACDGKNCAIEWFHFECVGITVPPKGKWYCPDCRKRYNIAEPLPNPQYFYNPSSEYMMSSTDPSQI